MLNLLIPNFSKDINRYKCAKILIENIDLPEKGLSKLIYDKINIDYVKVVRDIDNKQKGYPNSRRTVFDVTLRYKSKYDIFNVQIDNTGGQINYRIKSGERADALY